MGACVGDEPSGTDGSGNDSSVPDGGGQDVVATDVAVDTPVEAEAGAPPCGEPGEDCCVAPLAPCDDGLTCSTATPAKCMISDAWAVGSYTAQTSSDIITEFVTAHYDGTSWTLGQPVKSFSFSFSGSNDIVDLYAESTSVRVLTDEIDVGHMYSWNGVSWQECKLGNSCVGPTWNTDPWAITSTLNQGATDYWLAGRNVMYRCAEGASSCTQVTGIPSGNVGTGEFAGQSSSDLWYAFGGTQILHFDGTTWTSSALTDAYALYDVGANDIWAGYQQLRHWDGSKWNGPFLIDNAKAPGLIFDIYGAATDDVFAVGHDTNSPGASFAAHWNGSAWKGTTLPAGMVGTEHVWAPSRIEAFAVGGTNPSDNKGIIAHWNGTAWTSMTLPAVSISGETSPGGMAWISVHGRARPRRGP